MYSSFSRNRTKEWVNAHAPEFADPNSPVGNLSVKFSSQSIDGTPRRRLSLDAASDSPGTPCNSNALKSMCNNTSLYSSDKNDLVPTLPFVRVSTGSPFDDVLSSASLFGFKFARPSDAESEAEAAALDDGEDRFGATNTNTVQSDAIVVDIESESVLQHPSLTSLSTEISSHLGGASPCPSSVFVDEDSQDSGYGGGDSQDGFTKQANFLCPVVPVFRNRHKLSVPCIQEERDDACHTADHLDFSQLQNKPAVSDNVSRLLSAPLLCSSFAQKDDKLIGQDSAAVQRKLGFSMDPHPIKNLGLVWGSDSSTVSENRAGGGGLRRSATSVLPTGKRQQKSPDSPSAGAAGFSGKRRRPLQQINNVNNLQPPQQSKFYRCHSESEIGITLALYKSSLGEDLIGNYDRAHSLPLVRGATKHTELRYIAAETMSDLLQGKYDHVAPAFDIVDCRYPYEYEGGHVKGSYNIYLREDLLKLYFKTVQENRILIFYCEFSSERGPAMTRFMRQCDRKVNTYPSLFYPEIYVLEGGYKNFFAKFKEHCVPLDYVPMLHKDHSENYRLFRSKCKSWSGSGTETTRSARTSSARAGLQFS